MTIQYDQSIPLAWWDKINPTFRLSHPNGNPAIGHSYALCRNERKLAVMVGLHQLIDLLCRVGWLWPIGGSIRGDFVKRLLFDWPKITYAAQQNKRSISWYARNPDRFGGHKNRSQFEINYLWIRYRKFIEKKPFTESCLLDVPNSIKIFGDIIFV